MSDLLIPFGIHRETGDIVEPEDAVTGRACNCLCPGCKAPLLCKHPKKKRDHFAHDTRHQDARPEQKCPFSSAVAVAMMVRNIASEYVGKLLQTPALSVEERCSRCGVRKMIAVTGAASNRIDAAAANVSMHGHRFDLQLSVSGFPVMVDLVYRGKPAADIDERALQADRIAVLELNCDRFSIKALKKSRQIRFSQAIMAYFLNARNKSWRLHPRAQLLREQERQQHHCRKPKRRKKFKPKKIVFEPVEPILYTDEDAPVLGMDVDEVLTFGDDDSDDGIAASTVDEEGFVMKVHAAPEKNKAQKPATPSGSLSEDYLSARGQVKPEQDVIKRFECVLCKTSWVHHGRGRWQCPVCHSHLYAREIRD